MVFGVRARLRDADVAGGLLRKSDGSYAEFARTGGNRPAPGEGVVRDRDAVLFGRIPQGPGVVEHDLVEGLRLPHVHLEPLPRNLGLRHVPPTVPVIAVQRVGGGDIDGNFGAAEGE